jgi:endoribonuclease Dicer
VTKTADRSKLGSGKTLIAVLLLHHVLTQELEERKKEMRPNKVAFFVVEKVALCFQQHKVLEDNLEFPIGRIHGDMTSMVNTKEFWHGQFAENMAVVTTAQVLLDCLNNGFISIRQINLLIFDEAHHAKKNHPYAKIIKNHYMSEPDTSLRPKILGMTASPVDAQTRDMQAAALELESMLCSEIATVSNEVLAESLNSKNLVETTEVYEALQVPEDSKTTLWDQIRAEIAGDPSFRPALDFTLEASSSLGTWCADRYWALFLTDLEITKLIAKAESQFDGGLSGRTDHAVSAVQKVQQIIRSHRLQPVSRTNMPSQISSKVQLLWQIIENEFRDRGAQRCIVFVQKRYTAVLLADLLQQPGMQIPGVVSSYMVGSQSMASSIVSMSFRDQVHALTNFKEGDTNCLFATPVGEEGIDIPACDLVIRFDMYNSVIQYIQSRGRARQANARFINLIERGNIKDLRRVKQAVRDTTIMQKFCLALPEDRKVQDILCDITAAIEAERVGQKSHEIKATGARLSFENSLGVLARFTSSLGELGGQNLSPEFVVIAVDRKRFAADVILPETSPVNCVSGFSQRSKQLARCSAAYEACLLLLQSKYIDNHLQPTFTKKLPLMRNARLAVSANKKSEYPMRIKPELWSRLEPTEPLDMFLTVLALESPSALGKPSRPLILLTREKLPSVPAIPLFFGGGHSSAVRPLVTTGPLRLTPEQLDGLRCFTLKTFADIFSKQYEAQSTDMPYFFAPCGASHDQVNNNTSGIAPIDWDLVHEIKQCDSLDWDGKPAGFFCEKLVVDPWDGSRKLVIHGINPQLKPGDRVPDSVPKPRSSSYRSVEPTIKEYSNSLFLKARQSARWRDDQPVVNAEIMSLRRNFLDQFEVDEVTSQSCYIILEPLKISPVWIPGMLVLPTNLTNHYADPHGCCQYGDPPTRDPVSA